MTAVPSLPRKAVDCRVWLEITHRIDIRSQDLTVSLSPFDLACRGLVLSREPTSAMPHPCARGSASRRSRTTTVSIRAKMHSPEIAACRTPNYPLPSPGMMRSSALRPKAPYAESGINLQRFGISYTSFPQQGPTALFIQARSPCNRSVAFKRAKD